MAGAIENIKGTLFFFGGCREKEKRKRKVQTNIMWKKCLIEGAFHYGEPQEMW